MNPQSAFRSRLLLVSDLVICSVLLLCINHELYFVPLLTMLLLVRIWVSFSTYRRSRMAICPLVLLAGMTMYICANPYGGADELFLMPLITLARGTLSLFGANRGIVETVFDHLHGRGWETKQIINIAAAFVSVWLFILPLGIYICRAIKKQLLPDRLTLCKNIGLCVYMLGILLLMDIPNEANMKIALFCLALLFIPLAFNRGKWLFSRGETAFMGVLVLLVAGYICGVGMEEKSMITASLLPAAFYAIVNWGVRREIRYMEVMPIVIGSVCFAWAQYTTGAIRVLLLLGADVLIAAVAIRFAAATRKYLAGAGLFAMTALIIPVLCIGYNPYTVLDARSLGVCKDYASAPNGLLYVYSKDGMGIRDRFGTVLPAKYVFIQILQDGLPYFKVVEDNGCQIYDIERHELVSEEFFSYILPHKNGIFILESDAGNRYLILPEHYDRQEQSQQVIITDDVQTVENTARELVGSIMNKLSFSKSIEDIVAVYNSESKPETISYDDLFADSENTEAYKKPTDPKCAQKVFFRWDEVLASIYTMPEKVHRTERVCPDCGERLVMFYFSSPVWTWCSLCGRAGNMTICPACPKQVDFELTCLN